jgi:hypothetical protein
MELVPASYDVKSLNSAGFGKEGWPGTEMPLHSVIGEHVGQGTLYLFHIMPQILPVREKL